MKTKIKESREDLARLFRGRGVEVGVAGGEFSEYILKRNPKTKLVGVDPYEPYKGYRDYTRSQTFDKLYEDMRGRLGENPNFGLLTVYSLEAAKVFEDESLNFVYIDGNHDYDHVTEDLNAWYPKVRPGGIIAGDDYVKRKGQEKYYDVVHAVDDWVEKNNIPELFIYTKGRTNWMAYK